MDNRWDCSVSRNNSRRSFHDIEGAGTKKIIGKKREESNQMPPVDLGKEFILFDEELSVEARFLVKETENGLVLECRELDCDNRHFGTRFTSSHYHATQHLNTKHQTHEIEGGSILNPWEMGEKKEDDDPHLHDTNLTILQTDMPHIEFSLELEHDVASPRSGSSQISGCNANHVDSIGSGGGQDDDVDSIGSGGGQDDDPEVKEVPPPPPPDVEYGSENEGQLPWEDKMVKAMQRDISAVLQ
eukprot:CAMPEP_0185794322 /NCGR_PEP_ID=MMETSP1174-20130828/159955_1 /TAXON_ID=35687 /ORGANISM="Dictyocha speculum, Strain CCMP1381" /LENGTH=242 /DNA_ID=CAMNT_0028489551 /DNA_START=53 /DNA_END=784 /DNA_ORIENTATION=-